MADWVIGAHVKMEDPLQMAGATDAGIVQIFLSDPQGWKKPAPRDDADALRKSKIPVIVHAPYIVNLASANNKIRIPSRKVLQQTMDAAAEIKATAVVVHGGHVDASDTVEAGVERWVKGLDSLETDVPLYLENTAGGDHAMARHFETIARLWDAIGDKGIGFRAHHRHHRPHRPRALQRLQGRPRLRSRPPRAPRRREHRPDDPRRGRPYRQRPRRLRDPHRRRQGRHPVPPRPPLAQRFVG